MIVSNNVGNALRQQRDSVLFSHRSPELSRLNDFLRPIDVSRVGAVINRFHEINTDVLLLGSATRARQYMDVDLLALTLYQANKEIMEERNDLIDYLAISSEFDGVAEIGGKYFYPKKDKDGLVSLAGSESFRVARYSLVPRLNLNEFVRSRTVIESRIVKNIKRGIMTSKGKLPSIIDLSFGAYDINGIYV